MAEAGVLLLSGLCLLRGFVLDWYQLSSGSMAPTLLGPHRHVACPHCGWNYACDALDTPPPSKRALCPNCWTWGPELASLPIVGGDRILMLRGAWGPCAPRRWSVVAFRSPQRASRVQVKRVLGLPGERIELHHGDVYANGRIQRKSLTQQRAMAQLVHDAAHDPTRWRYRAQPQGHGWRSQGEGFACSPPQGQAATEIQWLTYCHQQPLGPHGSRREAPPLDRYAYNQNRTVWQSFPVEDLLLSSRLAWQGEGDLCFRLQHGSQQVLLTIALPAGELTMTIDGMPAGRTRLAPPKQEAQLWELSTFDGQVLLAVDGITLFSRELKPVAAASGDAGRPLAIGSRGLSLAVRELRVWRDLYYYWPVAANRHAGDRRAVTLGPEEYFVAGDNVPISDDSRSWARAGVPQQLLVGRPLLLYWRSRTVQILGWQISIPQLSSIGYIR